MNLQDVTATTWFLECRDPTATSCDIYDDYTFTQGPSTIQYKVSHTGGSWAPFTLTVGCGITTDHGLCTFTQTGKYLEDSTSYSSAFTAKFESERYQSALLRVTITAGLAVVSSTSTATAIVPSTPSDSNTGSILSSTAGAPMVTNGPVLFAGGVAAAFAFAAM